GAAGKSPFLATAPLLHLLPPLWLHPTACLPPGPRGNRRRGRGRGRAVVARLSMFGLPPSLIAAFTGFISGLVVSVPPGPVNLTIMNEGARRGFKWAALIGLGATLMEVLYCAVAFTSFAAFFQNKDIKASMEVFSFAFMLFLGLKFLMAKSVPKLDTLEQRI